MKTLLNRHRGKHLYSFFDNIFICHTIFKMAKMQRIKKKMANLYPALISFVSGVNEIVFTVLLILEKCLSVI